MSSRYRSTRWLDRLYAAFDWGWMGSLPFVPPGERVREDQMLAVGQFDAGWNRRRGALHEGVCSVDGDRLEFSEGDFPGARRFTCSVTDAVLGRRPVFDTAKRPGGLRRRLFIHCADSAVVEVRVYARTAPQIMALVRSLAPPS